MNLFEFKYPDVSDVARVFPAFGTIPELLAEAKARGFYNGNTKYNRKFSELFFNGGKFKYNKKALKHPNASKMWLYCLAFMGSFQPKHEEKEAICSMIMSEILKV